jgi:disulfide bond formation protein DsbB
MRAEPKDETDESRQNLWLLIVSPAIWTAHFLLSYITAAVWCAKFAGRDGSLGGVRVAIGTYTAVALLAIAVNAWGGLRRHRHGSETTTHDFDTPADRHRFLGFATVLLAALSFVATIFVAMVALFFEDCR